MTTTVVSSRFVNQEEEAAVRLLVESTDLHAADLTLSENSFIGQGRFGEIHSGLWKGIPVVIKQIKHFHAIASDARKDLAKEADLLQKLDHPHIVKFFGAVLDPPEEACMVMELATQGSMHEMIHTNKEDITPKEVVAFLFGLSSALAYLHDKNVYHRSNSH